MNSTSFFPLNLCSILHAYVWIFRSLFRYSITWGILKTSIYFPIIFVCFLGWFFFCVCYDWCPHENTLKQASFFLSGFLCTHWPSMTFSPHILNTCTSLLIKNASACLHQNKCIVVYFHFILKYKFGKDLRWWNVLRK